MSSNAGGFVTRPRPPWISTVTADAVKHFAWGIGDDNPLWFTDPAAPTAGAFAPPCLLYAVDETTVAPGHDDLRRVHRSVDWVWLDRVGLGAHLAATRQLIDEAPDGSGLLVQTGRVDFTADGVPIATAIVTCERPTLPGIAPTDRPELRYDGAELEAIEQRILAEERRGAEIRHAGEAGPGSPVGPITKGPLSIMDVVAWCAGTQGVATELDEYADGGLHDETATGPEVVAWFGHLVGDWMGDAGFLHRLSVSIDHCPPLGSTTTLLGQVERIDESGMVHLVLEATDHLGQPTASATASVLLPTRDHPVHLPLDPDRLP